MAVAAPEIRDVILRDGSTLRLRPPRTGDAEAVLEFFGRLSEQSVYWRFHGFPSLTHATVEPFLEPDWEERGSLVGALSDGGAERIVALASFVRLRDPAAAEVAFTVADELQGNGLGHLLIRELKAHAARRGITRFVFDVLAANDAALAVARSLGAHLQRDGATIEGTIYIESGAETPSRSSERARVRRVATHRPIRKDSRRLGSAPTTLQSR